MLFLETHKGKSRLVEATNIEEAKLIASFDTQNIPIEIANDKHSTIMPINFGEVPNHIEVLSWGYKKQRIVSFIKKLVINYDL